MMMYPEYREDIERGRVELSESDFFTAFGKRVFSAIMELHSSGGFVYALLGESFTPDEMSALEDMQVRRRSLTENGHEIFRSTADILKSETQKQNAEENGGLTLEEKLALKRKKLEEARKKRGVNQ